MTEFAILDTETTGLGRSDRVVEIAVIVYDSEKDIVIDEFDTMVNPMRDIGPTNIHGLTPSMVSAAPTFDEVATSLSERLNGSVLVAHNLSFDVRMLGQDFDRVGGILEPGQGICILRLTGESLASACQRHGVELTHHHRALTDARAAFELFRRFVEEDADETPASVFGIDGEVKPRTLRRDHLDPAEYALPLARLIRGAKYPTSNGAVLSYLDALDWVLDDLVIDQAERAQLDDLARSLGLDQKAVHQAHRSYFNSLVVGAQRDGIITDSEHGILSKVVHLLDIHDLDIPEVSRTPSVPSVLSPGARVCFTGTAFFDGDVISRTEIEETAALAGLQPVGNVTRQCDLLVCADTSSMSGKTKKARSYGIPIMSFDDFVASIGLTGRH
jgi:DNA polymerase-3 subunit epsilon